jgi:hypothetical protein
MKTIIAVALALMLFGCLSVPGGKAGDNNTTPGQGTQNAGNVLPDAQTGDQGNTTETEETDVVSNETTDTEQGTGAGDAGQTSGKTNVLMLGRSVAYGWSEYMGLEWQEDESYLGEYDGKTIRYLHMDSPPDIDDSAIRAMETYDYDVVFFKLCFVDFGSEYGDMLADDKQYIENVYQEAVVKKKRKLIVGNALPQVARDTTPGLKQNHQEYNRWLNEFASTHEGVYVLDLYGMLADGSGALKAEYASSSEDSHPNSAGYARITPAFMDKVEEAQGG